MLYFIYNHACSFSFNYIKLLKDFMFSINKIKKDLKKIFLRYNFNNLYYKFICYIIISLLLNVYIDKNFDVTLFDMWFFSLFVCTNIHIYIDNNFTNYIKVIKSVESSLGFHPYQDKYQFISIINTFLHDILI